MHDALLERALMDRRAAIERAEKAEAALAARPSVIIHFGPDATPEQVQTAREQIAAMMEPVDWDRLWESIAFTGISRADLDLAREAYEREP